MSSLSRRAFFVLSSAALGVPAARVRAAPDVVQPADGGLPESFPSQEPDIVRQVVLKAHIDYDAVRELVTPRPQLAKAAWDWGFGDWETALGAASHMGRRDIAELLIDHGARPNLFTFAMFDQVDVVRAICDANPGIQRLHGPHGITLLGHARNGKAQRVTEYLDELGDADIGQTNLPLEQESALPYVGDYEPRGAPDVVLRIAYNARREVLTIQRGERQRRFLMHLGDHTFNPGGAASVRIDFEVRDGRAGALNIRDGDLRVTADRRS
jgi:hypothetical protein